jgi:hypothetical protein
METTESSNGKTIPEKKPTKTKVSTISDFRTHYEAIVNKIV